MPTMMRWLMLLSMAPLWASGLVLDRIAERQVLTDIHERLEVALHAHQQYVLMILRVQQDALVPVARAVAQELASRTSPHPDVSRLPTTLLPVVGCQVYDLKGGVIGRAGAPFTAQDPGNLTRVPVSDPFVEPTDPVGRSVYEVSLPLTQTSSRQQGGRDAAASDRSMGTLVCRVENTLAEALTAHRQGLKLTGEVYLVSAKTRLMLTGSRFIPHAIGRVTVDTDGVHEALKMRNGIAPYPDYRGVPVIGAFLYLRDYDWVLLAEMDEAEALAPLVRLRIALVVSLGGLSLLTGLVGWRYGRTLDRATVQLQEAKTRAETATVHLRTLLGAVMDAVIEIDEQSTILIANEAAHRMFGWPEGELIGQNVTVLMPPAEREKHQAGLRRYLDTGEHHLIGKVVEVTGSCRDGTLVPCELSLAAMTLPDGQRRFVGIHRNITDRKKADAIHARLIQHLEASPDFVGFADATRTHILFINRAGRALCGLEKDEDLSTLKGADFHPAWTNKLLEETSLPTAIRTGVWCGECAFLHRDGHEIPVIMVLLAHKDANGRVEAFSTITHDITERKQAEEALARLQHYYELVLTSAGEGIYGLDKEGRTTFANPAAAHMLGRTVEELIGQPMHSILHHSWPDGTPYPPEACPIYAAFRDGVIRRITNEVFWRKDGSSFPVVYISTPIRDQGLVVGAVVVFQDLSAQRQTEETLRQSETRFRMIVETTRDWVWQVDENAVYTYASPRIRDLLGYAPDEVIGRTPFDLMPPGEARRVARLFRPIMAARAPFMLLENTNLHKDGHQVILETSGTPIFDQQGVFRGYHGMDRDITERKAMEQQARRLERLAALGQLLGGIAHELRNPLFVLTGRLQLLREKLTHHEYGALEPDLAKLEAAGQRLTVIVERFLRFARPYEPKWTRCSVETVLQETLGFLANELMKNRIQVVTTWTPTLPPVWTDPQHLQEVFLNLILNAMQAMVAAHGQGRLTVTTALSPGPVSFGGEGKGEGEGEVEVRIGDDGPGIAPEHRIRLFEPFFTTKPPDQGTGLGLWTVRALLMALHGTVTYETEVGHGTTFIVRLPIGAETAPAGFPGSAHGGA